MPLFYIMLSLAIDMFFAVLFFIWASNAFDEDRIVMGWIFFLISALYGAFVLDKVLS